MRRRVAIVGGGPAGLFLAVLLGRRGIECVVFEREEWPVDKVCGEGIMPIGVAAMERAGLLSRLDPMRSRAFRGIRYVDPSGALAEGRFRGEPGLVVRRLALSEALFELAAAEPCVELRAGAEFLGLDESPDSVELEVRCGRGAPSESAGLFDFVVGADGLRSRVRRAAGLEGAPGDRPGKQPRRFGARAHYRIAAEGDLVEVWWQAGIECYVAPSSDDCVELNFGWDADRVDPRAVSGAASLEAGLLSFFPELAVRVKDAVRLSSMRSYGPLPQRAETPLHGRVALIGDAGVFFDQITGEGLSLAFLQAELLAEHLPDFGSSEARAAFTGGVEKLAAHYIKVTGAAMFFTRHARLRRGMIALLGRSPELFAHLLHANMGEVPLVRGALGAALRGLVRPAQPQGRKPLKVGGHADRDADRD